MSQLILKALIEARNKLEGVYNATRNEMISDPAVPNRAIVLLIKERDRLLADFDSRINKILQLERK